MKYYATLTTPEGEKIDLSGRINGRGHFFSNNRRLKGALESNAIEIYCHNTHLKALVKDCGKEKRQIWSQKVGDVIYTYIGCGRFTLEEAIAAINKKYTGKKAADYIDKVKLSQSMVE